MKSTAKAVTKDEPIATPTYTSPMSERYGSDMMRGLFSDEWKLGLWRYLWIVLAKSEQKVGVPISDTQIGEMYQHSKMTAKSIGRVKELEKTTHHDVMANILAFGEECPNAAPIIHLGATSCYVTDNTDILRMQNALSIVEIKLTEVIDALCRFADEYKWTTTLAYTHMQAAQPTTVGKRATLWIQDLQMDLQNLRNVRRDFIKILGCRGATGTSASFLQLVGGDPAKVEELEKLICSNLGMEQYPVCGQTYPRKVDFFVLQVLSGIAQSATKFANDIRFLSSKREIMEPFDSGQVGSSAMPYKQNPMRCERMTSLARHVMCDLQDAAFTASSQFCERTLDDSADRRLVIPESFIAIDSILDTYKTVVKGLRVNKTMISTDLQNEKPFFLSESILMYCVEKKGCDRQQLHEALRKYSAQELDNVSSGKKNTLLEDILKDPMFKFKSASEMLEMLNSVHGAGIARTQTDNYIKQIKNGQQG